MLPEDLKARAQQRAAERGMSLGELVRESLARDLETGTGIRRQSDSLFAAPAWEGETPEDLAAEHDRYLYRSLHR